ncbi:MAG: ABC transporter permease [Chloroflexota bacterium]
MFADTLTVIYKEWKEMFFARSTGRSGLFSVAVIVGLLGIFMPLQNGRDWLTTPLLILIWSWLPVFLTLGMVTDSIAGERERHTLETLLASRLPEPAILLGKIGAAVFYAWGIMLVSLLLGAVAVNLAFPGSPAFYDPRVFGGVLVFCLLASLLIASIGVLVSLHSKTARQAYQKMSVVFLVVWFLPMLAAQFLPEEIKAEISAWLITLDLNTVLILGMVFLLAVDCGLLLVCLKRFQRPYLISL